MKISLFGWLVAIHSGLIASFLIIIKLFSREISQSNFIYKVIVYRPISHIKMLIELITLDTQDFFYLKAITIYSINTVSIEKANGS